MRDTFANRLQQALHFRHIKQIELADKLGIHRGTINNYIKRRCEPGRNRIDQIAKVLDINPMWLLGYNVDIIPSEQFLDFFDLTKEEIEKQTKENAIPYTKINYMIKPLHCTLSDVDILDTNEHKTIIISDNFLTDIDRSHLMLAKMANDSMNEKIPEGAFVIIQKTSPFDTIHNYEIVLYRYGNALRIKEFIKLSDKVILRPKSTNSMHKDNVYTFESLAKEGADQVQILGIVKKVIYDI